MMGKLMRCHTQDISEMTKIEKDIGNYLWSPSTYQAQFYHIAIHVFGYTLW